MKTRKQAVDLTELAIGIVVLGVAVTIGATILLNTRDSRLTDLSVVTTINETVTLQTAGDTFANTWVKGITACINATGGEVIGAGNYTLTVSDLNGVGTIVNASETYGGSDANCTYTTYNTSRADWTLADNAATGVAEFGNWFKILVVVGVAAVILSLIFLAFGNRGNQSGVTY